MSNPSSLSKRLLPTLHVSREPRRCFPTQDSNFALLLTSENEKLRSFPVDINLNSCSQCLSFSDLLSLISISAMFYNSMLWTTEWLELLFPVLLGFLCKSKMADETQANEHSLQGFLKFRLFRAFPIRPLQGRGCWFLHCCFFFVETKLEGTKIHGPSDMVAQFYAAPYFLVHKKVRPPPHLQQPTAPPPPPPSNKWPVPYFKNDHFLFKPLLISSLHHLHFFCAIWHDCGNGRP